MLFLKGGEEEITQAPSWGGGRKIAASSPAWHPLNAPSTRLRLFHHQSNRERLFSAALKVSTFPLPTPSPSSPPLKKASLHLFMWWDCCPLLFLKGRRGGRQSCWLQFQPPSEVFPPSFPSALKTAEKAGSPQRSKGGTYNGCNRSHCLGFFHSVLLKGADAQSAITLEAFLKGQPTGGDIIKGN